MPCIYIGTAEHSPARHLKCAAVHDYTRDSLCRNAATWRPARLSAESVGPAACFGIPVSSPQGCGFLQVDGEPYYQGAGREVNASLLHARRR